MKNFVKFYCMNIGGWAYVDVDRVVAIHVYSRKVGYAEVTYSCELRLDAVDCEGEGLGYMPRESAEEVFAKMGLPAFKPEEW